LSGAQNNCSANDRRNIMTGLKLFGAALAVSALLATPASAWQSASEPAAAASQNPNFSIYSNGGATLGSRAVISQPFNANAEMLVSPKAHRPHRAPIR
jgi:hypothetical protein